MLVVAGKAGTGFSLNSGTSWSAAKLLIDQHGEDAALNAGRRADLLLEEGDTYGAAVWRAIVQAIEELQRERGPDEAVN